MKNRTLLSIAIFPFLMAIAPATPIVNPATENPITPYTYRCSVYIKDGDNNPVTDVEVYGGICGGISCSGSTAKFKSQSLGEVTLTWNGGPETTRAILAQGGDCGLCTIYIGSTAYKGEYVNGGIYNLVYPPVVKTEKPSGKRKRKR